MSPMFSVAKRWFVPASSPVNCCITSVFVLLVTTWGAASGVGQDASAPAKIRFDLGVLSQIPKTYAADSFAQLDATYKDAAENGIKPIFYQGLPYQGKSTKVFAYYGIPKPSQANGDSNSSPEGKVPGVVLIHGGGGTAFANWVKLWNSRGYAAIAMDLCGCVPVGSYGKWERHAEGGPPGWDASFQQIDGPESDQWQYHAVSAVTLAHTLLRSFPGVDPDRIGVTGISWGGYMTCLVAGVDSRYKCSVPVYGCGYLGDNSVWLPSFESLGSNKAEKWLKAWDPSVYLPDATAPMLWVNGTNDFAYPMDSWQRSSRLPKSTRTLCLRINMPHGHGAAGENPEEIHVFMNSILRGSEPLAVIHEVKSDGQRKSVRFSSSVGIKKAELCYTMDSGPWQKRNWIAVPAIIDQSVAYADLPTGATVWYFNLFDERDCVVSSEHCVVDAAR